MRYYVTADTHGFYTEFMAALDEAGYFKDQAPHKLIICGDLFDRGKEAVKLQQFVLDAMDREEIILIKGNHEDLFEELVTTDQGLAYSYHVSNGTYATALQLTGIDLAMAQVRHFDFAEAAQQTPFYQKIIPAMRDYYETEKYVFTHGWIPCIPENKWQYSFVENWRESSEEEWKKARWLNGMVAFKTARDDKTVVCGHWHASFGHCMYGEAAKEFGQYADFSPFYAPGIIALDACTAASGKVNVVILEDEPLT